MEMEEEDDESDGEEKRLETKDRYVEGKARKPAEAQKAQRMQDTVCNPMASNKKAMASLFFSHGSAMNNNCTNANDGITEKPRMRVCAKLKLTPWTCAS